MANDNMFAPPKLPYERPQMGTIRLSGNEVMGVGCKTAVGGSSGKNGLTLPCTGGAPCDAEGS